MKVVYSRRATQNIASIYRYIEADSERAARDVVDRIDALIQHLADQPGMGRETATAGVRSLVVPRLPYRVFYSVVGEEVRISTIRHTSRRPLRRYQ